MSAGRSGIALLAVLVVVALLEVIIASLSYTAALSLRSARNHASDVQTTAAVDGLVRVVGAALCDPAFSEEQRCALTRSGDIIVQLGSAAWHVEIEDENGKLNVNLLAGRETAEACRAEFEALLRELSLPSSIVDDIAGSVREQANLDALTAAALGGPGRGIVNGARYVPPEPLARYVTCWGDGRVNINTAPLEVLRAVLAGKDELLEEVITGRLNRPYESLLGLTSLRRLDGTERARILSRLAVSGDISALVVMGPSARRRVRSRTVIQARPGGEPTLIMHTRVR